MAWVGLIRTYDERRSAFRKLTVRVEDTRRPGCLIRVYDDDEVIGEEFAPSPHEALQRALEMVQCYLEDPAITEDALDWVQV